jgi:phosphohistidine phosphatase SixA
VQNRQTIDQQATKIKEGREALIGLEQQMLEAIDQLQQEVRRILYSPATRASDGFHCIAEISNTTQPIPGLEYSRRFCGWDAHCWYCVVSTYS